MSPEFAIFCEQVALDAAKALPAAMVAALLVQRAKPPQACSWSLPHSTTSALTSRFPAGT